MATHHRPLHALLGGGAVADLLLWRRRNASAAAVAGASVVWFLFERAGYSLASVLSNALLLLVVILFFWAKSASLLNRPLPPVPNLEVSDVVVEKAVVRALVWVNKVLAVAHDIAIKRDRTVFIQVIMALWVVSCIGMLFNFFTLIYIGVLLALLVPPVYERHQDVIDEKVGLVHSILSRHLNTAISKTGQPPKQKKAE
ncbi:unnamed protein product [Triticum aestivum]|uniref:Reticulon-like protein n=5 Tax=Triticinae TaxID=1648030 RepID=A0A9R1EZS8_WHEAT|nr:reticulon-like protein B11 [Aegilops tauschii subsp. strangulata]XP_020150342.1 reticulon-like protein B11 [Aegilops tauschii subsp. strangulata]XP_044334953.1 reticulon-like protein B11 [Triticum aestivum]XP_044334954.1 reticulon-like protein B11 [Triticum aestivum]KAF7019431.1 hypothetical protein CFC21_032607 [Triticum aestivum]SPT20743.1 unnamed protein product [Triticum aestivum]